MEDISQMDSGELKVWTELIGPDDLDTHLAGIGQAQANAELVKQMFKDVPLQGKLLISGCGTGQLFDYILPLDLGNKLQLTLTDINYLYLERANARLSHFPGLNFDVRLDNIESTRIQDKYEGVLITLVLEHVEWMKALDSMQTLKPNTFYIIVQEQTTDEYPLTLRPELSEVWQEFSRIVKPKLIPRNDLVVYFSERSFRLVKEYERNVPNNKIMKGFIFKKT